MHSPDDLFGRLAAQGVDLAREKITLMRHKDAKHPLEKYIGTRALELYQASQPFSIPPGNLVVAVFGNRPKHGVLLGVWRVREVMAGTDAVAQGLTSGSFESADELSSRMFHQLERTPYLAEDILKLEIEWPGLELKWCRHFREPDKPVIPARIRPEPPVAFQGLEAVSMVMSELRIALELPIWQQELARVKGIYLITDERGGQHYVGSASGERGVLGRWTDYAKRGHGGNKLLEALLEREPGRENDFRITLLEALPQAMTTPEVICREHYWKRALGSRTFGLNAN